MRILRHNHDQILIEMERLNMQLKEEQNRVLTLQNELKMSATQQRRVTELQEQVIDLQREVDTLKEANEKLVGRWARQLVCLFVSVPQLKLWGSLNVWSVVCR